MSRSKKKALSDVVAYVLLISITLALSVMVYAWLRFYVSDEEVATCSEGVSVIITDYQCYPGDRIVVDLKNKGRFTIDGFSLRIHNRTEAEFGFYLLNATGTAIKPGETHTTVGSLTGTAGTFNKVTYLEIQPFIKEGEKISCKALATQAVTC